VKDITKLEFVIIGISTIITICAYSLIGANSSQLALMSKIWCQIFGHAEMAPLARRWHVFFS